MLDLLLQNMTDPNSPRGKPMGWLIGLGVLCIALGVIAGLIGITVVAIRKQRFREIPPPRPAVSISEPRPHSARFA